MSSSRADTAGYVRRIWGPNTLPSKLSAGRPLFGLLAVLATALILVLGRNLSFHGDEWAYIIGRDWLTLDDLLAPHNEHLAALHVLQYRGLVELLGTGSYVPFLATLMLCHVAFAAGVFALLSNHLPRAGALAGATLVLYLGSGYDNLLWAFQTGFVGAAAFGVWALATADRPRLSAALLTAALWTHGSALFFVVPVAILSRDRRWLLIPLATYAAWLLVIGRESVPFPGLGPYLGYALTGFGNAFGGLIGFGPLLSLSVAPLAGPALGLALATLVGVLLVRFGRWSPFVLGGLAGLGSEFGILAFGRAHFGVEQALASRYVYVAAPFLLMVLSGLRVPRPIWAGLLAIAMLGNLITLPFGVLTYEAFARYDRTFTMEQRIEIFR